MYSRVINEILGSEPVNPKNTQAYLGLGNLYWYWKSLDRSIDVTEGITCYLESLYYISFVGAQYQLAQLLEMDGRLENALLYYQSVSLDTYWENLAKKAKKRIKVIEGKIGSKSTSN